MNWNLFLRQAHRWLSIAFTVAVAINLAALATKTQSVWIGLIALVPLILLLVSGLYMFFQPYVARARGGRRVSGVA